MGRRKRIKRIQTHKAVWVLLLEVVGELMSSPDHTLTVRLILRQKGKGQRFGPLVKVCPPYSM